VPPRGALSGFQLEREISRLIFCRGGDLGSRGRPPSRKAVEPGAEAEGRVLPEHAGAGITHDGSDLLPARALIAMHGALDSSQGSGYLRRRPGSAEAGGRITREDPGAQPSGCRGAKQGGDAGGFESSPPLSRCCSLKAAPRGRGGHGERRHTSPDVPHLYLTWQAWGGNLVPRMAGNQSCTRELQLRDFGEPTAARLRRFC